jgi:ABC-type phosphate/phosphonate transport system substrate-binding protein
MPRRLRTAALSLALLSALAACGGSSSSSPKGSDATGTTGANLSTNPPTATLAPGSTTSSVKGNDFCSLATGSVTSDLTGGLTPDNIKTLLTQRENVLNAIKDNVPAEVKADVAAIVDASQKTIELFKKYDYDYEKVYAAAQNDPALLQQLAGLSSAEIATASQHLLSYCGLTTPTT